MVVISQKHLGQEFALSPEQLHFVAKGYYFPWMKYAKAKQRGNDFSNMLSNTPGMNDAFSLANKKISPIVNPANQMNSGMALLYPSPCIIMAIPPASGNHWHIVVISRSC